MPSMDMSLDVSPECKASSSNACLTSALDSASGSGFTPLKAVPTTTGLNTILIYSYQVFLEKSLLDISITVKSIHYLFSQRSPLFALDPFIEMGDLGSKVKVFN